MQKQKLLDRLTNNPKGATFHDVSTLLFHEGFELKRIRGSHYIFSKSDTTFVIPVHGNRVKSAYVRRIISLIQQTKEKTE
jgi:predicted RNA binding protein YcfA (HicA-like mRNA interferase family)